MELKVGDVVRLKSGGPAMTVKAYPFKTIDGRTHSDMVECEWFNRDYTLIHHVFSIDELEYDE